MSSPQKIKKKRIPTPPEDCSHFLHFDYFLPEENITKENVCTNCDCKSDNLLCIKCGLIFCDEHVDFHYQTAGMFDHDLYVNLSSFKFSCMCCKKEIEIIDEVYIQLYKDKHNKLPDYIITDFGKFKESKEMMKIFFKENSKIQNESLFKLLFQMTKIPSQPKNEKKMVDFIVKFIEKEKIKHVKLLKDPKKFGVYVEVGNPSSDAFTIFIDAHIDQYQSRFIEPFINPKKDYICATALDNRISVALLLNCLKYESFENIRVCVLFSTQEEIGSYGINNFFSSKKNKAFVKKYDEVCVMDVTFGKHNDESGGFKKYFPTFFSRFRLRNYFGSDIKKMPVIGKGICVVMDKQVNFSVESDIKGCDSFQSSGIKKKKDFHDTNMSELVNHMASKKSVMFVPVVDMHHLFSYASCKDIVDFYTFTREKLKLLDKHYGKK